MSAGAWLLVFFALAFTALCVGGWFFAQWAARLQMQAIREPLYPGHVPRPDGWRPTKPLPSAPWPADFNIKPRIKRSGRVWECSSVRWIGVASSPRDAYAAWRRVRDIQIYGPGQMPQPRADGLY